MVHNLIILMQHMQLNISQLQHNPLYFLLQKKLIYQGFQQTYRLLFHSRLKFNLDEAPFWLKFLIVLIILLPVLLQMKYRHHIHFPTFLKPLPTFLRLGVRLLSKSVLKNNLNDKTSVIIVAASDVTNIFSKWLTIIFFIPKRNISKE